MRQRMTIALWLACVATVSCGVLGPADTALARPIKLLTVRREIAKHQRQAAAATREGIVPPPLPCPQNGVLPGALSDLPTTGRGLMEPHHVSDQTVRS